MIYLDNAATTLHKPPEVAEAVKNAILTAGNAARGAHGASLSASRMVFETRSRLAELFARGPCRFHGKLDRGAEYRGLRTDFGGRSRHFDRSGAQFRAAPAVRYADARCGGRFCPRGPPRKHPIRGHGGAVPPEHKGGRLHARLQSDRKYARYCPDRRDGARARRASGDRRLADRRSGADRYAENGH